MRNFKDIIIEKLKVTKNIYPWQNEEVPSKLLVLDEFAKFYVNTLGKKELPISDIYEYLDVRIPIDISHNNVQTRTGKVKRKEFKLPLDTIECSDWRDKYIIRLNYGDYKTGVSTIPYVVPDITSITDNNFFSVLGNNDKELGMEVFKNIIKKTIYESNR